MSSAEEKIAVNDNGRTPLSIAIMAYNCEAEIRKCLDSVKEADDIVVVVDSKTTDATAKVVEDFGGRVYVEQWKGYGPQKRSAVEKCRNDWVLILDSDERLSQDSFELIREAVESGDANAYSLRYKNFIGSRWIKHAGWWHFWRTRLFNRNYGSVEGYIHEGVKILNGNTKRISAIIEHTGYLNYAEMIDDMNEYSTETSKVLFEKGRRANYFTPILHAGLMFFKKFIIQGGILGGIDGLVVSVWHAEQSFYKYIKLMERRFKDEG